MNNSTVSRIPEQELAEHFYSFLNRLMGALQKTFVEEHNATGISQKDIGERIGRSPASVSRWLSGQQNMTIRTMHDLARGMGCRLNVSLEPLRLVQPANRPAYLEAKRDDRPISGSPADPLEFIARAA